MTEMLHGRARNEAIKAVVYGLGLCSKSQVRVELGKGTAHSWATITTPSQLTEYQRDVVTAELIKSRLIGQYPDDMSNKMYACVHFNVRSKS